MRNLLLKIRNSEFLSHNEILSIKITFLLIALFLVSAVSIPFSLIVTATTVIQIIVPGAFAITYVIAWVLLLSNAPRTAMHFSILSFFILMGSFLSFSNPIYIYLVVFAILSVIIYYQEGFPFFVYGTLLTLFGIAYMLFNVDLFGGASTQTSETLQIIIYQVTLFIFYVYFLLYFINSEVANERYYREFLSSKTYTQQYLENIVRLKAAKIEADDSVPVYETPSFQQALTEIATFLGEMNGHPAKEMQELVEFYMVLHDLDIDEAMSNKSLKYKTKETMRQLKKYLLNANNEFTELAYELLAQTYQGLDSNILDYETSLESILRFETDRIIAGAMIYRYLKQEVTQTDKWGRVAESLDHGDIKAIYQSPAIKEYFSDRDIGVFLDNEDIYKKM